MISDLGAASGYEVRHQNFVMVMPQSGERIRGRERMREFQAAFGQSAPAMRLRRPLVRGGLWVAEVLSDYGGGRVFHYVSIVELRDGKMWRDIRYYAEPFEGFSDLILQLYGPEIGDHARSAVGMAELPLGVPVEIEAEVAIRTDREPR